MTSATATSAAPSARTLAAVLITVLAWASAFVTIRGVGHVVAPGALALGRLLVGTLVLGLLQSRGRWVRPTAREWRLVAVCGVTWFGLYNVVLNSAERHLDAGTTAMLVGIGPILIAVLAGTLLGEGFPGRLAVGIVVAFAGAALIGLASRAAHADVWGVGLSVVAALLYASGVVAQKPALRRLPPVQVTFTACAIGTVTCLPWTGQVVGQLGAASPAAIAGVAYLGAVPTALAFSTWAYALARMDAGSLGVTTYVVPPLVILLGWLGLGEIPPALAVVGGTVCLAGVAIARRRRRTPSPASTDAGADRAVPVRKLSRWLRAPGA